MVTIVFAEIEHVGGSAIGTIGGTGAADTFTLQDDVPLLLVAVST